MVRGLRTRVLAVTGLTGLFCLGLVGTGGATSMAAVATAGRLAAATESLAGEWYQPGIEATVQITSAGGDSYNGQVLGKPTTLCLPVNIHVTGSGREYTGTVAFYRALITPPDCGASVGQGTIKIVIAVGGASAAVTSVPPPPYTCSNCTDVAWIRLAAPQFTADTPQSSIATVAHYTYKFQASGASSFSVTRSSLPPGLELDGTTGVLAGIPSVAGTFRFQVTAANGIAPDATHDVVMTVVNGLAGGTFIALRKGTCTTAFAVVRDGHRYEAGALHCTGEAVTPIQSQATGQTYAPQVKCTSPDQACLAVPVAYGGPGRDSMAWLPDRVRPVGTVLTGQGVLPVVGQLSPAEVAGQTLCHFGYGSEKRNGNAQRCATAPENYIAAGRYVNAANFDVFPAAAYGGDSGGPVYAFDVNASGETVGVYIVGIVCETSSDNDATLYVPIQDVEQALGVRLLVETPLVEAGGG
jgi:hypothetical protein